MIHTLNNEELESYLQNLFKEDYYGFLNTTPEPNSIRINTLKTTVINFTKKLKSWGQQYKVINFNPTGLTLQKDDLPLSHTLDYF
ncbi:MAG: hypothetical protein KAS18_08755, partial [Calditrichia bacterium]|nr:hypothetical protein [Calditrichia bacterium]